jgi:4-hydroxybenzoate polyprenyltransferase
MSNPAVSNGREPAPSESNDDRATDSSPPSGRGPAPPGSSLWLWRARGLVITLRPHQWVKNVFVLAPVVFAKEIFDSTLLGRAAGAFIVFCVLASAVYTLNDLVDAEADRAHPVKRYRPIAAGRVSESAAKLLLAALLFFGLGGALMIGPAFLTVVGTYLILNLAYSFKLKKIAYLDVTIIATGFVLRVVAGGIATQIQVSSYLLACTALLALFLGFGKRRHELAVAQSRAAKQRASLEAYSARGLDLALGLTAVFTIGCYVAYTLDARAKRFFQSDKLWLTAAFVVLGVSRFLYLVRHRPKAESPTQEMLRDGMFVAILLVWVGVVLGIVYNLKPS